MVVLILITTIVTLYAFIKRKLGGGKPSNKSPVGRVLHLWDYDKLRNMIKDKGINLPAMFVDVDILDSNINKLVNITRPSGKTLRIATKSIRCPELIQRVLDKGGGVFKGLMCFSMEEIRLLSDYSKTLDDFYMAYPTLQRSDIKTALDLGKNGKKVTVTVDSLDHIKILDDICDELNESNKNYGKLRVAIDLDMSTSILGVILGPHRSRINSVTSFSEVIDAVNRSSNLVLVGAMGYEGHVAGLPDDNPHGRHPNPLVRFLKRIFLRNLCEFRKEITKYCIKKGIILEFFNGGGSGNIREACADDAITEVTAGSAFLQAQMFDYYVKNECSPAFGFALQCTRIHNDYICCQSGGFVASGTSSQDKFPVPFANPVQLCSYSDEGYGEVQTPLQVLDTEARKSGINLGDPVFFRPAKSGEIAEHFNTYYMKRDYTIIGQAKTYRGLGGCFH